MVVRLGEESTPNTIQVQEKVRDEEFVCYLKVDIPTGKILVDRRNILFPYLS